MWFPLENYDPTSAPQTGDVLSDRFQQALPGCVGLWLPSIDDRGKALDFNPTPSKNLGAIASGVTTVPGAFGTLRQAWNLNSGAYIKVNDATALDITSQGTVGVLFYPTALPGAGNSFPTLIQKGTAASTSANAYGIGAGNANGTQFALQLGNGSSSTSVIGATTISINNWYFVAGSWNGPNAAIYTNGVLDGSTTTAVSVQNIIQPLVIGVAVLNPAFWFDGYIAAVVIFDRELSSAQHTLLYGCLLYGKPFPLFQPQVSDLAFGSAAASAGGLLLRRRRMAA